MSGLTSTHKLIEILTNDVIASNCFMKLKSMKIQDFNQKI